MNIRAILVSALAFGLISSPGFCAERQPLVIINGQVKNIPVGDTISSGVITAAPAAAVLGGSEPILGVQGGATVSVTPGQLSTYAAPFAATYAGALNLSNLTSPSTALNTIHGLPHAANNTALTLIAHTTYATIVRDGFAAAGDAPPLTFVSSASPCSINAGGGDGGSQVPSSDGKCWLANFSSRLIDVREFGANATGASSATTAIQNDINYVGSLASTAPSTGAVVYLPAGEYLTTSTITISQNNTTILGDGKGRTLIARNAAYGDTFTVNNSGQIQGITFRGITMFHDLSGLNAMTGAHIDVIGGLHILIEDVNTQNGAYGIIFQGGVYLTVRDTHLQGDFVSGSASKNSIAGLYLIGTANSGAVTLPSIVNIEASQVNGSSVDYGFEYGVLVNAAEEVHFTDDTFNGSYYAQNYLQQTSANLNILEITYTGCFFDGGGTATVGPWFGLWIDGSAGNGSAVISRIKLVNTEFNGELNPPQGGIWGEAIHVDGTNRGGGYPQALLGLEMTGSQVQAYYADALDFAGGVKININGVQIFQNNTSTGSGAGINFGAAVTDFLVGNSQIGESVGTSTQKYAVTIANGATGLAEGNNLCNNATGPFIDATGAVTTSPRGVILINNTCFNGGRAAVVATTPTTNTVQYNWVGSPAMVSIAGGTVTSVKLNGTQICASSCSFQEGPADYITLTWSVSPTVTYWPQ